MTYRLIKRNTKLQRLALENWEPFPAYKSHVIRVASAFDHNTSIQSLSIGICTYETLAGVAAALRNKYLRNVHVCVHQMTDSPLFEDRDFCAAINQAAIKVAEALRDHPHFPPFIMSDSLAPTSLPGDMVMPQASEARAALRKNICWQLRDTHFDKVLAFAMGRHPRLGSASALRDLGFDCVSMVAANYFRLPGDSFTKARRSWPTVESEIHLYQFGALFEAA
jgi:hypothetical protein